jgi:hypothetical protein
MRRDQDREAVRRKRMDFVPELAPRFRIDARGRLVEQENSGFGNVQAPSASRCFQPPESSPASCPSRPSSPSRSIMARAAAAGSATP